MKLVEKSLTRLLLFGTIVAAITMHAGSARAQESAGTHSASIPFVQNGVQRVPAHGARPLR
jgi:hypothetical protein